eukprot:gene10834-19650_t
MDADEKRKRRCDDEIDRITVTDEGDLEDSDPCESICSGEERWPSRPYISEDDKALATMNKVFTKAKRVTKTSTPIHRNKSIIKKKKFSLYAVVSSILNSLIMLLQNPLSSRLRTHSLVFPLLAGPSSSLVSSMIAMMAAILRLLTPWSPAVAIFLVCCK